MHFGDSPAAPVARAPVKQAAPSGRNSLLGSLLLHGVLAAALIGIAQMQIEPIPPRKSIRAVIVARAVREAAPSVVAQPVAIPPPKPKPTPTPSRKPVQAQPVEARQAVPPTPAESPADRNREGVETEDDSESLLGRLRANWLAPPGITAVRCAVRIDYREGRQITQVIVHQDCGDRRIGDSIERAVWKTQPLPLPEGSPPAGSIEVEFSS